MQKQFVFLLIVAILVAIFAITNAEAVTVRLFFWTYELSGSLLILFSVALGALLGFILNAIAWLKHKKALKVVKSQLEASKNENERLKAELEQIKNHNDLLMQQVNEKNSASVTNDQEPSKDSKASNEA